VRSQRVIAAAAALSGRATPTTADLWPIVYVVPTEDGQRLARDVLRDLLAESESQSLAAAAEEASRGPLARATRLEADARGLLAAPPDERAAPAFRLKLEGALREIDAGFSAEARPAGLAAAREALIAALGTPS
jgi:MoxR-like ATPase